MIPLRTELRPRSFPFVTRLLVAANVAVFGYQLYLGQHLPAFFQEYALIPNRFTRGQGYLTLMTSAFLHGSWLHLLGNLITLWVFGDNVEDRMGHLRFLFFYLTAGLVSAVAHVLSQPLSSVPCVGASGAIAGVLGAALVLFPKARVLTLVPFFVIIRLVYMPAFLFLLLWFGTQIILVRSAPSGLLQIAVVAHIGGFLYGVASVGLFRAQKGR